LIVSSVSDSRARGWLAVGFPAGSLLAELDAFFTDHHHCGDLDAGVDGAVVWIACPCGASMARGTDEAHDAVS
jgi:hypothetical protein